MSLIHFRLDSRTGKRASTREIVEACEDSLGPASWNLLDRDRPDQEGSHNRNKWESLRGPFLRKAREEYNGRVAGQSIP